MTPAAARALLRNARNLARREGGRCAWPRCRADGSAAYYERGSTELTQRMGAAFCERHLVQFGKALDHLREESRRCP